MATTHFDLPFQVAPGFDPQTIVNQPFGPTGVRVEPPAHVFPDTSVDYFTPGHGSVRHDHVHAGVDYGLNMGTPLFAPANGLVTFAREDNLNLDGTDSGFGNMIKINHGDVITHYAHLSTFDVHEEQRVSKGQQIGRVGNTGPGSLGAHLHFGVIRPGDNHYVNPALFVITPVRFTVKADADGNPVRVFQRPTTESRVLRVAQPGEQLQCNAWAFGEPRFDASTGHNDARFYRLVEGGWVASARVQGNAPNSQPLP